MNKGLSLFGGIIAIVLVVALMIGGYFISTGNSLVNKYEEVNLQKSQIEVSLQKRADLIPNLVECVTTLDKQEALGDYNGYENTLEIVKTDTSGAAFNCASYVFPNGETGYLPAVGE